MSIHVGTTDSPIILVLEHRDHWDPHIAVAMAGRPRLTGGDTGGVHYCGQAAWNIWTLKRTSRQEKRDARWEWLDLIGQNLRDIARGWGDSSHWCSAGEDVPF